MAAWAAAVLGDPDHGAAQNGPLGGQFLDPGIPHPADERGVNRDLHTG